MTSRLVTIVEIDEAPAVAGVFYALMLGWRLNAEDAKVTQRRREEGEEWWVYAYGVC